MEQDRLMEMAFDWVKNNTVKAVFKTAGITVHNEDIPKTGDPRRVWTPEQIQKVVSSVKGRTVGIGIDHKGDPIPNAGMLVAGYNESIQGMEGLLQLPENLVKDIKEGKYKYVSWDVIPKDAEKTSEGIVYKNLYLDRIDLVSQSNNPGDPNCEIELLETEGKYITEIELHLGEPMGQFANWDECITWASGQSSIDDPEAYCGYIKAQTESGKSKEEIIESLKTMVWKKELVESTIPVEDPKDKRIKELEESMNNIVKANDDIKKNQESRIRESKKEGNLEIIKEVEKVTPGGWSYSKWTPSARRYREDIAKILWKKKEELKDEEKK